MTRATATLIGAAAAGALVWLGTQFEPDSGGGYWARIGLFAAAGLALALSQLLGGWTKWGRPHVARGVLLVAFVPALVAAGWVLLAAQPGDWFNTSNWSGDLGIRGLVGDLETAAGLLAFGLGLLFGLTFDTTGPRTAVVERERSAGETVPAYETAVADEPLTAERAELAREQSTADGSAVAERRPVERTTTPPPPGRASDEPSRDEL